MLITNFCYFHNKKIDFHGPVHEAIKRLTKKIEMHPDSANLYFSRGQYYVIDDDFNNAYCDYKIALKLAPEKEVFTQLLYAKLYNHFNKPRLAFFYVNQFLESHPNSNDGLITRASTYFLLGNEKSALIDIEKMLQQNFEAKPDYYYQISDAIIKHDSTEYQEAIHWLRKGEERLGFNIALKSKIIDILVRFKNHDEAINEIDSIINQLQRKEKWIIEKAKILEKQNKYSEAYQLYEKAFTDIQSLPNRHKSTVAAMKMEAEAIEGMIRLQEIKNGD